MKVEFQIETEYPHQKLHQMRVQRCLMMMKLPRLSILLQRINLGRPLNHHQKGTLNQTSIFIFFLPNFYLNFTEVAIKFFDP